MLRPRFTVRQMMVIVGVFALLFGLNRAWIQPKRDHRYWHDRVAADYEKLTRSRPPEVTRGQWEFLVGWTMNLHANYGSSQAAIRDQHRAERFVEELESRLQKPASVASIDWIWDEYMTFSKGQNYDFFRPTRSPDMATSQPGCFGMNVP